MDDDKRVTLQNWIALRRLRSPEWAMTQIDWFDDVIAGLRINGVSDREIRVARWPDLVMVWVRGDLKYVWRTP